MAKQSCSGTTGRKNLTRSLPSYSKETEEAANLNATNSYSTNKLNLLLEKRIVPNFKIVLQTNTSKIFADEQYFLDVFKKPNTLKQFIKKIFNLRDLKGYESIVLFYHLRGQPTAGGISYTSDNFYSILKTEVGPFTALFKQIKKSKGEVFNTSSNTAQILPIIGAYLGQAIQTNTFDLVFIISRNDFLPPDQSEINLFNNNVKRSIPFLSSILKIKDNESKFELLKNAIERSTLPFSISLHDKEIYRSENYQESDKFISIPTINDNLKIKHNILLSRASELLHYQRVAILGELLNTLQHELSNPLFGIKLSSELQLLSVQDPEATDFYKEIFESTGRCQNIITDFSSLYRAGDGYKNVNLYKSITEALTLSKSATQNIEKNLEITLHEQTLEVFSNPRWINQIVFNAIINSAQALHSETSNSNKKISIKIEESLTDIAIIIKDNGPGIPASQEKNIFSAFFTTKVNGTGLGLSICQNLADKLSAEVYLNNNEKKGCSFTLVLKNEKNITS